MTAAQDASIERPERPFQQKIPGSLGMEPSRSRSKSVESVAVSVQLSVGALCWCSGLQTFLAENPSRNSAKTPLSSRRSPVTCPLALPVWYPHPVCSKTSVYLLSRCPRAHSTPNPACSSRSAGHTESHRVARTRSAFHIRRTDQICRARDRGGARPRRCARGAGLRGSRAESLLALEGLRAQIRHVEPPRGDLAARFLLALSKLIIELRHLRNGALPLLQEALSKCCSSVVPHPFVCVSCCSVGIRTVGSVVGLLGRRRAVLCVRVSISASDLRRISIGRHCPATVSTVAPRSRVRRAGWPTRCWRPRASCASSRVAVRSPRRATALLQHHGVSRSRHS